APVRVSGNVAGEPLQFSLPVSPEDANATQKALPSIWARMKISDLAAQSIYEPNATIPEQIKQVALDYDLMSEFTAFLAVDSTQRTGGAEGTTVPVAVPVPEDVKYDTTVPENHRN
ncbi:MAG TPA: hypothetical protein VJT54_01560, partial [Verrucomicrobiae bacterium]|nr:hypothetical protein [Verrucomicrobiae bacterium]